MSAAAVMSGAASMSVAAHQPVHHVGVAPTPDVLLHYDTELPAVTQLAPAPVDYMAQKSMQYVDEQGMPVELYESAPGQYVDELGNPVQILNQEQPVQYVDEWGNPVQLVGADGQPVVYEYVPAAAPAVYNITPEQFALLARGGTLSQAEVDTLVGVQAAAPVVPDALTTPTSAPEPRAKASKKKSLSSKKKSKGCC